MRPGTFNFPVGLNKAASMCKALHLSGCGLSQSETARMTQKTPLIPSGKIKSPLHLSAPCHCSNRRPNFVSGCSMALSLQCSTRKFGGIPPDRMQNFEPHSSEEDMKRAACGQCWKPRWSDFWLGPRAQKPRFWEKASGRLVRWWLCLCGFRGFGLVWWRIRWILRFAERYHECHTT